MFPVSGWNLKPADAVLLYVSHYIGEHTLDEVGTDTSRIVFLATQPLGYVPDNVPQVKGSKSGLQPDGYGYMPPVISPHRLLCIRQQQ